MIKRKKTGDRVVDAKKSWCIYSQYVDEIIDLLDKGYTVKQIYRMLFHDSPGYEYQNLLRFVNTYELRYVTGNDGYERLPICNECDKCLTVKRHEKGVKDMRVCIADKREIASNVTKSPKWCPKRDKKRQGEV